MGTTLENGVYLPSEGERNCYAGLKTNWEILDQKVADVTALQQAVAGALHRQIVASLPTTDIDPNTIYMVLSGTSATENVYNEFMYVNNAWELIGTSATDLTNYYTKVEVDGKLLLKASASDLTSHTGDTTIHVTASDKTRWTNSANTVVLRLAKTALTPSSSTNAFSNLDDSTALKVGDKVMDTAGVLFEVTAIDTQNSTFTIGTALIDLANDSDVVHKTGDETIAGVKSFSDDTYVKSLNFTNEVPSQSSSSSSIMPIITTITYGDSSPSVQARLNLRVTADGIKSLYPHENLAYSLGLASRSWSDFYSYHGYFRGQQQNDEYSGNARTNLTLLANRDTLGQSGCLIDTFRENISQGTGMHILGFGIKENGVRYEGLRIQWVYDDVNLGYDLNLKPNTQGTNKPLTYNLGTSTDKWDSINGLSPSSLGMPDLDNGIDISSYITVVANKESLYTPPSNGWISVALTRTGGANMAVMLKQGNFASSGHNIAQENGTTTCNAMLPVKGGVQVSINSALADGIAFAYFYPCLGNI